MQTDGILWSGLPRRVHAGFTTILGNGRVPSPEGAPVFGLRQVHSDRVVVVAQDDDPETVQAVEADALVTVRPDAYLTIRTADCVPVLIAARSGRGVAAVHAGWRGLASGIIGRAVARLCTLASVDPSDLVAAVGPAIGPCCYEVELDVGRRIAAPAPTGVLGPEYGDARVKADVFRAACNQLLGAGLVDGSAQVLRICTRCHGWLLHSYRRSGPHAGRQLAFIAIVPEE